MSATTGKRVRGLSIAPEKLFVGHEAFHCKLSVASFTGMCATHKDEINADLLAFIKG